MKKIAFVYRSVTEEGDYSTRNSVEVMPPLWALALWTYLRAARPGLKVELVDEQLLGRKAFLAKLSKYRCAVAGLSPTAHTYQDNLAAARLLKKNGATVVLGGHYATPAAREILAARGPGSADHCVDYVVRYEGEKAFAALAAGGSPEKINNLVYVGAGGKIVENPVETMDLAALPETDYELADLKEYFKRQTPPAHTHLTLPYVAQRGCRLSQGSARCMFCSIQSSGPCRSLPPERAARALAGFVKKFGVGYVYEGSDDWIADMRWVQEFAAAAKGLKLPVLQLFVLPSRLNQRNLALLRSINVRYLSLGTESLAGGTLRALSKGATPEVNLRAINVTREAGLVPNINLILGLPGESRGTLSETFAAVKRLDLPADAWRRFSCPRLALFPGTEVHRRLLAREPKYRGLDFINADSSFRDWTKHFCSVTLEEVMAAQAAMLKYASTRLGARA